MVSWALLVAIAQPAPGGPLETLQVVETVFRAWFVVGANPTRASQVFGA